MNKPLQGYAIVIDTDKYAGNFERELTAHLTGHVGECQVGQEFVDDAIRDKFEGSICSIPDEHGCHRPTSIFEHDKTGGYESVAIWFEDEPTSEQLNDIYEGLKTYHAAREDNKPGRKIDPIEFQKVRVLQFKHIEETLSSLEIEI